MPLLVAAAVAAGSVGLVVVRGHGTGDGSGLATAGPEYSANALTTPRVGKGQYAHTTVVTLSGRGASYKRQRTDTWISPSGSIWRATKVGNHVDCEVSKFSGRPSFGGPTSAFIDTLPTGTDALQTYLERHVSGSTSREEAMFVAVGDLLREGDGLTSARLRGALVEVLSRTDGIRVDTDSIDKSGRKAIRVAFVDLLRRPDSIESLYFSPGSYDLLQEMSSGTGRNVPADSPSVPYSQAPEQGSRIPVGSGPVVITLYQNRTIVDRLPSSVTSSRCTRLTG